MVCSFIICPFLLQLVNNSFVINVSFKLFSFVVRFFEFVVVLVEESFGKVTLGFMDTDKILNLFADHGCG